MQIFEIVELNEFPYMETREVVQGQIVGDILDETSIERVFLLIDHDTKRIWTYNGLHSSFKVQIYGGILAGMFRQQLRLFYRVYPLNMYSKKDQEFQELLQKPIGGGRVKPIEKKDFPEPKPDSYAGDVSISNPKPNKALEYISQFPNLDNLIRRFEKRDFPEQKNEIFDKDIPYSPLDRTELKKLVDDLEKQEIKIKDFENYELLPLLKSAEKKIESIMKKESINELTIERQYLLEIFNADLVEISKNDGLPILKSFVIIYFMFRGISTTIFGNIIKLHKIYDKPPVESEQAAYLYYKMNLDLEARRILEKIEERKSLNFKKLYTDAIIREGNLFFNKNEYERAAKNYERAAQWSSKELSDKKLFHEVLRLAIISWISACRVDEAFRILQNLDHKEEVILLKEIIDKIGETGDYLSSMKKFEIARELLYRAINRYQLEDFFDEIQFLAKKLTDVLISLFKQQVGEKKKLAAKNTYNELEHLWDSYKLKKINLDSTLRVLINQFFESKNFEMASLLLDKLNSRKLKQKLAKKIRKKRI